MDSVLVMEWAESRWHISEGSSEKGFLQRCGWVQGNVSALLQQSEPPLPLCSLLQSSWGFSSTIPRETKGQRILKYLRSISQVTEKGEKLSSANHNYVIQRRLYHYQSIDSKQLKNINVKDLKDSIGGKALTLSVTDMDSIPNIPYHNIQMSEHYQE